MQNLLTTVGLVRDCPSSYQNYARHPPELAAFESARTVGCRFSPRQPAAAPMSEFTRPRLIFLVRS